MPLRVFLVAPIALLTLTTWGLWVTSGRRCQANQDELSKAYDWLGLITVVAAFGCAILLG